MFPLKMEVGLCLFNVVLSIMLFIGTITQIIPYRPIPQSQLHFPQTTNSECLFFSYLTGQTKCLTHEQKTQHQVLGLSHLFTPSGIHLAALFLPLAPFLRARFKWATRLQILILILLFPLFKWVIPSPAGARMALIQIFQHTLKPYSVLGARDLSLTIGIFIDILLGGLNNSPASLAMSYIFLAILNYSQLVEWKKIKLFAFFFLVQSMICCFWGKLFFPLGALTGQFLSLMFPISFILSLITWPFLNSHPFQNLWEVIMGYFYHLSVIGPKMQLDPYHLILSWILFLNYRKLRYLILCMLIWC